ncbi:alpha/beta fold hydrolase [Candidatus Poribacteria bacterium]|nr:alpha/beta fold hydrolase [Candidatus Poribacteria bacterium]MYA55105.1 alpha/beta fold hydrolase [Candidatus Poribacteria bacterium]
MRKKEIRNEHGERLDYTFHEGEGDRIVVIGHGVTGNKDRPALIALAEGLADAGISALRFSFSGNGESEGAFTDSTITKEVADLGSVIDALDGYNVCYVGHSMGGAVGVLRTSTDKRIQLLVSLAGMVHTKAFAEREFGDATPDAGFMWDEPDCPLSQAYVDDMATIDSVAKNASKFSVPWLLVHGTEDDIVPPEDSHDILQHANEDTELLELPGVDHVFSEDGTAVMVEKVVAWICQNL